MPGLIKGEESNENSLFALEEISENSNLSNIDYKCACQQRIYQYFDLNSTDLNQISVLNSSVWEVQAIANHYSPSVAQEIKLLNSLPSNESDVCELLDDNNFESLLEEEMNKNYKSCPLLGVYDSDAFKNSDFFHQNK